MVWLDFSQGQGLKVAREDSIAKKDEELQPDRYHQEHLLQLKHAKGRTHILFGGLANPPKCQPLQIATKLIGVYI